MEHPYDYILYCITIASNSAIILIYRYFKKEKDAAIKAKEEVYEQRIVHYTEEQIRLQQQINELISIRDLDEVKKWLKLRLDNEVHDAIKFQENFAKAMNVFLAAMDKFNKQEQDSSGFKPSLFDVMIAYHEFAINTITVIA